MLQFINFFSQSFNSPSVKVCVFIELVIRKSMAISVFTYEIVSHSLKVWKTLKTDLFCIRFLVSSDITHVSEVYVISGEISNNALLYSTLLFHIIKHGQPYLLLSVTPSCFIHWDIWSNREPCRFFFFNVKLNFREILPEEWQEGLALIRHSH